MKNLFLAVVATFLTTGAAHAERWIVKNPHASLHQFNPVKMIELRGNIYMVVNAPAFATLSELQSYGEAAFPDAQITLPETKAADDGLVPADDGDSRMAWHVKAMQYEKLPAQFDGRGVVVAILDTGVDYTHPALVDHIWSNEKEIAGNGIDDDANGYIDDVRGWDFELARNETTDENGHGTHCAGIVAASVNPTDKAQGVAPGAKIMTVKIIGNKSMGFLSDAIAGIKYAADNGAKVLSNSWRVYKSWEAFDPSDENIELMKQAIIYAGEKGAVFVAASGNESTDLDSDFEKDPMFPGGYTGLNNFIVVAASDQKGEPAYFTNYGVNHVGVAAPGVSVISTVPGNQWESMSGTSMSAPLVAGAVARGLSATFAPADIGDRLMTSSTAGANWGSKVRAKGVIDILRYLTP